MIRTHRPTGHHWTCASHFQQSKQYRNLDAQDWHAPSAKTLVTDPDDELPGSSRVAKRRKVESLANGFLEGKPLFISSACANGPDLTTTVENVLHEKKLTWDELLDDHDDELWADGEDGWTALKKRGKARSILKSSRSRANGVRKGARGHIRDSSPVVVIAKSSASCSTTRPGPGISTLPSDDALTRAAELRARKGLLSAKPAENLPVTAAKVTQSAPPTARAASSFKQCSSSRPFNPNTPAETTMADELRLSRTDSPSHRPRAFAMPVESFCSEVTVEDTPDMYGAEEPTATGSTDMELCTAEQSIGTARGVSSNGETPGTRRSAPACNMYAAWTPINDRRPQHLASDGSLRTDDRVLPDSVRSPLDLSGPASIEPVKTPRTRSAAKATSQKSITSARSRKSTTTPGDPRETSQHSNQSLLTKSFNASKSEYIAAEQSQSGTTPFVYRKKVKAMKADIPKPVKSPKKDSPQHPQSTEDDEVTPRPSDPTTFPSVSAAPPTLDFSFNHDSSFAPALNMALVEEHINRKLPNSPQSARRSSSVKKALRAEMRLSGADLSRVAGEPSSSQPEESLEHSHTLRDSEQHNPGDTDHTSRSKRRSTSQWPGTQVLLSRAQHDLFMSPDKAMLSPATAPPSVTRIHSIDSSEIPQQDAVNSARQPLRQLSQEFLPGTQALIDNWSPWSTAKKAKPGKRASFAPSPLMTRTPANPATERSLISTIKRPDLAEKITDTTTKQRRSSLRFSISTFATESPNDPQRITATPLATVSHSTDMSDLTPSIKHKTSQSIYGPTPADANSPNIDISFTSLSFPATAAQRIAAFDDTTVDWSEHDETSGFQNAQGGSEEPLAETIMAEVAREFLDTGEFGRVVGQV